MRSSAQRLEPSHPSLTWIADGHGFDFQIDDPHLLSEDLPQEPSTFTADSDPQKNLPDSSRPEISAETFIDGENDLVRLSFGDLEQAEELQSLEEGTAPSEAIGVDSSPPVANWEFPRPGIEQADPSQDTLHTEIEQIQQESSYALTAARFRWGAFIEEEFFDVPLMCGEHEFGSDFYFGGDNRSFVESVSLPQSRVTDLSSFSFLVPLWDGEELVGWGDPSIGSVPRIGNTNLYDGSFEPPELIAQEAAPFSDVEILHSEIDVNSGTIVVDVGSSNPLCTVFGIFDSPEIKYHYDAEVENDGAFAIVGWHTRAPSHEAFLQREYIRINPLPSRTEYINGEGRESVMSCLLNFDNDGFSWLALPPTIIGFSEGNTDC